MAALKSRFVARLSEDLAVLRGADPSAFAAAAHRLAGTAGVFGFADLSRLALVVDDQARTTGPTPSDLAALVAEMERVITHG